MFRLKRAAFAAAAVAIAGCTADSPLPVAPEESPRLVVSDAARGGPVAGFYFLPPMVKAPAFSGTFDAALAPRVVICELAAGGCGPTVAVFTATDGKGGERVTVNPQQQEYQVNWHTNRFSLNPVRHYRISVEAADVRLGFADVDVVASGSELKNVDTRFFVPLHNGRTLPIKFRIETGIAGRLVVSPAADTVGVGETSQFTASVTDLHGNPLPGAAVTWASSDPAVATVQGSGLATGVAPGTATIAASVGALSGTAQLTVEQSNTPPVAAPDAFDAVGNLTVPVAAPGVLGNDSDGEGSALQAVAGTFATSGGGSVTVNADGSFIYLSAAGFTGADTFTYTVTDGVATATGTATMTAATRVWYVSNAAAAPGDGRDASPFATLKAAETASAAGETLFLLAGDGTTVGLDQGLVLKAGQVLTGQGITSDLTVTLNGQAVVLLAAGNAPLVARITSGPAILLASNNTVQGVNVTSAAGAGIAGSNFGTLFAGSIGVVAANGGPAVELQNGTATASFGALSSAGSTRDGVRLAGVAGSVQVTGDGATGSGGTIIDAAGDGVSVSGSAAVLLRLVRIEDAAAQGVDVAGTGSLTLDRAVVLRTGGHGVRATGAAAVALNGSRVERAGNAAGEAGLFLSAYTGTATVDGSMLADAAQHLVRFENTGVSGTLRVRNGSTLRFSQPAGMLAQHGILVVPGGSAALAVEVENSTFTDIPLSSLHFHPAPGSTGAGSVRFTGNTVNATASSRSGRVTLLGTAKTVTDVVVSDNTFTGVGGNGLVNADAGDDATVRGTIARNRISDAAAAGIVVSVDDGGLARLVLDANQVTGAGSDGIQAANFGGGGSSRLDLVVTNNRVNGHNGNPATAFVAGITVYGYEDSTCLALAGNWVAGTPAGYEGVYLEHGGGAFRFEEAPNTAATGTVTPAFILAQNPVGSALANGAVTLSDGVACARP